MRGGLFGKLSMALALAPIAIAACKRGITQEPVAEAPPPSAQPSETTSTLSVQACRDLLDQTDRAYSEALKSADRKCSAVSDCEEVWSTCNRGCNDKYAISKTDAERYRNATASLETDCARFASQACSIRIPLPALSCPMYRPQCVDNQCSETMAGGG